MSTSFSSEQQQQVLQMISFTILNDSTIENRFSQDGRRWRRAMRTIKQQEGWVRTLWGRDVNTSHKIDIFIAWTTIHSASAFRTRPDFPSILQGLNISPLTVHCITPTPTTTTAHSTLSPRAGLTELVSLFFFPPATLTDSDQESFEAQLQHYTLRLPHDEIRSSTHGWTMAPAVGRGADGASARGCLVFLEWGSLDRMFEVKRDAESLYNNCFVPLREETGRGGARTALYARMWDGGGRRGWGWGGCGVM